MAIWQFTAYLVPESACVNGALPGLIVTCEEFEVPKLRFGEFAALIAQRAAEMLPAAKSWHRDLQLFGDQERNDIQLWYDDGELSMVCIRIDLREITKEYVSQIVRLAVGGQCRFLVVESQQLLHADVAAFSSAIAASNAARFVRDPRAYLESLDRERSDESR